MVGDNALALELRKDVRETDRPVWLVAEPDLLPRAAREAPDDAVLAVTALSPGGERLGRRHGLSRPVATFGSVPPFREASLTDVGLPPRLVGGEREAWRESLEEALGPVREVREAPGLVVARILSTLANEAAFLLGEGGARAEDIDLAMTLGVNYPRGPLMWADLVGLDLVEGCLVALAEVYGPEVYRPAPELSRRVAAGETGALRGCGFFMHPRREEWR